MKKATMASLLAVSAFSVAPGLLSFHDGAFAQLPGAGQPAVTMEADEFAMYDNAVNKQTTPQTQAPALEAYLAKYPKSSVKTDVLTRIMIDYSSFDHPKAITAADAVLQVTPDNLQAYVIEVAYRREAADAAGVDAATKQSGLDAAAAYAQTGLKAAATKPKTLDDKTYQQIKAFAVPTFYSTIGEDALNKKDADGAIAAYKAELAFLPADQLSQPAALQETFFLGDAYFLKTPPDYLSCAYYTTRAAALAPDQFKPQLQPLADFCFRKYHGPKDASYNDLVTMAKASLTPPADLSTKITPAPTDADQANALMKSTPDDQIPALAVSDREYVLQYASADNKAKIWDAFKGKEVAIPGALVIESSPTVVKVAVSDDAVQNKKADFTFNMKAPEAPEEPKAKTPVALAKYKKEKAAYDKQLADIAAATAVGKTVELSGTWSSYTPSPIMIVMDDGAVVFPKPTPAAKTPVHRKP